MNNVPGNAANRQLDITIWQNRWNALEQAIQDVIASFPQTAANEKHGWHVTLETTLACLHTFGKKQFDFFQNGFKQGGFLADSPRFKAEYALRKTLDQVAFDLSVLQRARNQRIESIRRTGAPRFSKGPEVLELADLLAYKALEPAIQAGLLEKTTVFTYFQKSSHVRVVPYAPVALIGIPYTCIDMEKNARDFLAIPHEIGHYVYWHGKHKGTPVSVILRSVLPAEPRWRANWLEEIFADVYGCLVAGPVLAYDFQELLFDNLDLFEDDGEHPVAAIRPYLYTDTLRAIKDANQDDLFTHTPDKLDKNWGMLRSIRENKASFKPQKDQVENEVQLDDARKTVEETCKMILTVLQPAVSQQAANMWSNDSIDLDQDPYQKFKDDILKGLKKSKEVPPKLVTKTLANPAVRPGPIAVPPNEIAWTPGESSTKWFELFNSAQHNGLRLSPETWNTLLNGGGWAAGGPDTDDSPK